jgi:hypothetical protein
MSRIGHLRVTHYSLNYVPTEVSILSKYWLPPLIGGSKLINLENLLLGLKD